MKNIGLIYQNVVSVKNKAGYTIVEVIVAMSILTVVATISLTVFKTFQNKDRILVSAQAVSQIINRAQLLSRAVKGDSNWGVYFSTSTATIYKGSNYVSRETSSDEPHDLPATISFSGDTEINFAKFTGYPSSSGSLVLSSMSGDTKTITVNEKGIVDY